MYDLLVVLKPEKQDTHSVYLIFKILSLTLVLLLFLSLSSFPPTLLLVYWYCFLFYHAAIHLPPELK